jgi:hypothetical protein
MKCHNYYSTLLPCGMPRQLHMTISCYYSPNVAKMNGILLLLNFGWLKIHFWKIDICIKQSSCDIDYSSKQ